MLNNIYKGNTIAFTAMPKVNGTPVTEIHGLVKFIIKANKTDSDEDAVILKESENGSFEISAEETSSLSEGRYWYEFRWYFNDAVYTLELGNVTVVETVFD